MKAFIFFFVLALILPCVSIAQPNSISVSGNLSHGDSKVISGADFGSKSPAAPYIWDACDDDSATDLDTHWPGQRYPVACESGTPDDDPYLMDYRSSFHGFSTMPSSKITKFICAATTSCDGDFQDPGPSPRHNSVITTDTDFLSNVMFAMYWHRASATWSDSDGLNGGPNYKDIGANGEPGGYLDGNGSDAYIGTCIAPELDIDMRIRQVDNSCDATEGYTYPNYKGNWIHLEFLWNTTNNHHSASWGDGVVGEWSSTFRPINNDCIEPECSAPLSISVGGYTRHDKVSATGNYRYWAAIYIDKTYSRVMLGNNSDWDSCTIREPQIPSAWATDEITATVNQGALPNGTAYLFVFDSANDANATGYPVTLEGSSTLDGVTITGVSIQ